MLLLLALTFLVWRYHRSRVTPRPRIDLLASSTSADKRFTARSTLLPQYRADLPFADPSVCDFSRSVTPFSSAPTSPVGPLVSLVAGLHADYSLPPPPLPAHTRISHASESAAPVSQSSVTDSTAVVATATRLVLAGTSVASGVGSGKSTPEPPNVRVQVVQHQDAGPSEPEPEVVETVELPPAYSAIGPSMQTRKFVPPPIPPTPAPGSSKGKRSRRPVTVS